jgi:DNA-entry nuclease
LQILENFQYYDNKYIDNNKLANGVNIEAYSIEDNGVLHFNVYVYNAQDGIIIDYATGESKLAE